MKRLLGTVFVAVLLSGCGQGSQDSGARAPNAADAADVITHRGQIEAGKRTADKVRQIGAQRQQDLQDAGAQ